MARPKKAVETILDLPPEPVVAEDVTDVGLGKFQSLADWGSTPLVPSPAPESPDDLTESPQEAPEAPPAPEQPPVALSGHALDLAHVGAKIVVTTEGAMLATSEGVTALPKTDPANRLPVGAKVWKTAEDEYMSDQLSANIAHPARIYGTASEAIRNFVDDFHPLGLHS